MKSTTILIFILLATFTTLSQTTVKLAVMKYKGGGDWYANPTSLPNLIEFCNNNIGTSIDINAEIVEADSPEIFNYPYIHLTGHGNIIFTESAVKNIRKYLESGGFIHIDDNYGLDKFIRRELKKIFPESEFVELPFNHPIYHQKYKFSTGLPKVHEHDNKLPQGFGLFIKDRLVCFYSFETDLGDGWEDERIHKDPWEIRKKALEMGANIISFVFSQ
jgi:hypothetical protein